MKVTPAQLDILRSAIEPLDTEERRERYMARRIPRAELVKDIDVRYRWDLLWEAVTAMTVTALYDQGCNDRHIDTALRSIVPPLAIKENA